VAAIQRGIVKQGKRNLISRHLRAKNDKETIAAWRLDLMRILQVFNVRHIASLWLSLTLHFQTELVINTQIMVSDIHRTIVKGQEGSGDKNPLVSDTRTLTVTE